MRIFVFILAASVVCSTQIDTFEMQNDRIMDFITGFLEGLNEKQDVQKLLECIKGIDKIIPNVIKGLELLQTGNPVDVIKGMAMVMDAVKELLEKIQPCSDGFEQIMKLITALKDADILKIVDKILNDPEPYVTEIVMAIEAFKNNDYRAGGKRFGTFLYKLFLINDTMSSEIEVTIEDVFFAIEGILVGLNSDRDINHILRCFRQLNKIFYSFDELIWNIRQMNWANCISIADGLLSIIVEHESFLKEVKPCVRSLYDIAGLKKKLGAISFTERYQKLIGQLNTIIDHANKARFWLEEGRFFEFGVSVGSILFTVLLQKL